MRVRILYHDHCFDGAASAAFFSRFYEQQFAPGAEFAYTGMAHKASQIFEDSLFDGDENAIVDLNTDQPEGDVVVRPSSERVSESQDAEHFRHETNGKKMYDPSYQQSCTNTSPRSRGKVWIPCGRSGRVGGVGGHRGRSALCQRAGSGGDESAGDAVDADDRGRAGFGDGAEDHTHDAPLPAEQIVADPEIQAVFAPLYQKHLESIGLIRERRRANAG